MSNKGRDDVDSTIVGARPIRSLTRRRTGTLPASEPPPDPPSSVDSPLPVQAPPEPTIPPPESLAALGLPLDMVVELALRHMASRRMTGATLATALALPPGVVSEIIEILRYQGAVAAGRGNTDDGPIDLTESGRLRGDALRADSSYSGAAPVTWEEYDRIRSAQSQQGRPCGRDEVALHLEELCVPEHTLMTLAGFLNRRDALLLHGPPGNGKTALARCLAGCLAGDLVVPRAVWIDGLIVPIFDRELHGPPQPNPGGDERWVRGTRPQATTIGLPSGLSRSGGRAEAVDRLWPIRLNGGLWVVDHLAPGTEGAGLVESLGPILEGRGLSLPCPSGARRQVPLDSTVVCCTSAPLKAFPGELLRRFPYVLSVGRPDRSAFAAVFAGECRRRGLSVNPEAAKELVRPLYADTKRRPNAADGAKLLDRARELCSSEGRPFELSPDLLARAASCTYVGA